MLRIRSKSQRFIALLPDDLNGSYSVVATAWGIQSFNGSWPCSRVIERATRFEFASNGDLVDIYPMNRDGDALLALSDDAQSFAESCIRRRKS